MYYYLQATKFKRFSTNEEIKQATIEVHQSFF
jgi:hypothetical protein